MSKAAGRDSYAALDLVPEAVVLVGSDGAVQHINDRARTLLDLDDEALGSPIEDVLVLGDDAGTDVTNCLVPTSGPLRERLPERVLRLRLASGAERPVAVSGRLGRDGSAVLTFRHAGRRERLDAVRSDLVATVSHEIRSPLTSVKGFTRTLLAKWERFSDEQKRQMLETINEDADRVTRLLTELLDVARIDAGRVRLERRMSALGAIAERVVEKVAHPTDEVPVTLVMPNGAVPDVYVDPDKIEQVLRNLLENALQHGRGAPVVVHLEETGEEVILSVTDEGPGISADFVGDVFGKFTRGGSGGTGLGLYITKGLVEAHGGRVWVESTPGTGTSFRVALPKDDIELAIGSARPTER
jgi:signal transduction histidine kinase